MNAEHACRDRLKWRNAYQAVAGRYVQAGGCTTVGVAGLLLGGGFGSFSKAYGTAAASLLEAEIVSADGVIRSVNEAQEPDLFWALKGGGGAGSASSPVSRSPRTRSPTNSAR